MNDKEVERLIEERGQLAHVVVGLNAELEYLADPGQRETKKAEISNAQENMELINAKLKVIERDSKEAEKQAEFKDYAQHKKKSASYANRIKANDDKMFLLIEDLFSRMEKQEELNAGRVSSAKAANLIARKYEELPALAEGPGRVLGREYQGTWVTQAVEFGVSAYGSHFNQFRGRKRRGVPLKQDKTSLDLVSKKGWLTFDDTTGAVV